MDISTHYLGLKLSSPLMNGAAPMCDDLDMVKQLEDAGSSAIVMHSLFEEQIAGEQLASIYLMEVYADAYAEALSYFPKSDEYRLGPDQYLEQIRKIKKAVAVPVIASLNGTTIGGWIEYAKLIEQAGADALELNVYELATDPQETGGAVEQRALDILRWITESVKIPVSVKLSPFFSSLANFAAQLQSYGAKGVVMFNRFYQPDIDLENQEAIPSLKLSDSSELLLRLRWLAILSKRMELSLACSGGVHSTADALKAVMCGAHAVQLVSAILRHGPTVLETIREGMSRWLEENEFTSLRQMQGSMSLIRCPDPKAFERANYMRALQTWRPDLEIRTQPGLQI